MGTWGVNTFENDGAMDWLGDFLEDPSEQRILNTFSAQPTAIQPGLIGKLMGKKAESIPGELDGEQVLAAAEVVASSLGRSSANSPAELKSSQLIRVNAETVMRALAAIDAIMKESNLKDCWEETDDFHSWKAVVEDLCTRLNQKG